MLGGWHLIPFILKRYMHLQYFSPSIICIEHDEEEEGEKLIDRKGDIFFSLYQIKPKNKVWKIIFFLENTNLNLLSLDKKKMKTDDKG